MASTSNGLFVPAPGRFKMRRSPATQLGFRSALDARVLRELQVLDELLRRRIVSGNDPRKVLEGWVRLELTPRQRSRAAAAAAAAAAALKAGAPNPAPPKTPVLGSWENGSLGAVLGDQQIDAKDKTIEEVLLADAELAQIRFAFDSEIADRAHELDLAQHAVLELRGIRDLLIARATLALGIKSPVAVVQYVLSNDQRGVADVVDYAVLGAARRWVHDRALAVADIDDDDGETLKAVRAARLSLTEEGFEPQLERLVEGRIRNQQYDPLVSAAKLTWLTPDLRERLYDEIRALPPGRLTVQNAPHILPVLAAELVTTPGEAPTPTTTSDDPFQVEFFVEDSAQLQVSTAAVKCAAQLYYVMTLGDELGVFDAVRYFTHRHLFRDGFAVEDRVLRRDLEDYVFSEQFRGRDEEIGETRVMSVTHDAERRSFYRQVFDAGHEPVPGDGPANTDFSGLWKILMLESARYLERAQTSPHPDSYVSRTNVLQAVEDLQYNLSSSCVGMATVMTPLMYAELDFVVKRILGHPEVRTHIVPSGGSWWKVVEKLSAAQGRRTRAAVLHNKARLGYALLRAIADYTPSRFEQDGVFSAFISDVDAFITTQSILQEQDEEGFPSDPDGTSDRGRGSFADLPGMPSIPGLPTVPGMPTIPGLGDLAGAGAASGRNGSSPSAGHRDEWDF